MLALLINLVERIVYAPFRFGLEGFCDYLRRQRLTAAARDFLFLIREALLTHARRLARFVALVLALAAAFVPATEDRSAWPLPELLVSA
jgi:hypothetical protein